MCVGDMHMARPPETQSRNGILPSIIYTNPPCNCPSLSEDISWVHYLGKLLVIHKDNPNPKPSPKSVKKDSERIVPRVNGIHSTD